MKESKFQNEQFKIAGVAENNSKFKTQNSKLNMCSIERHPFKPFLPEGCRLLMLGSFPPAEKRWSMHFYYPNFTNDMWRIFGLCFFADKLHFVNVENKTFRLDEIIEFLTAKGIGMYDTATAVRRLKNTAADKDLEVVEPTNLKAMVRSLPRLEGIVTTGQKATDVLRECFDIKDEPRVGEYVEFEFEGRMLRLWRMPSSSRAYPLKVEKKAEYYERVLAPLQYPHKAPPPAPPPQGGE